MDESRAAFVSASAVSGRVLATANPRGGDLLEQQAYVDRPFNVLQAGEAAIAQNLRSKNGVAEFSTSRLPKLFRVVNRAQKGNVKVWAGGFNSVLYPEGAVPEDRSTWLQPGEEMMIPTDAVLHLFGNIFNPTFEGAMEIIQASGGFLLDRKNIEGKSNPNDQPRIIGGPLFLPDFEITGVDGRNRIVGETFYLYETYERLTRRLVQKSLVTNAEVVELESEILQERLREYALDDGQIYDHFGQRIVRPEPASLCDCSAIEHEKGVRGCAFDPSAAKPEKPEKKQPVEKG